MATSKNSIIYEVDVKTGKVDVTIGKVTKSFDNMGKAAAYAKTQTKQLGDAVQTTTKKNAQMIDKTGLAGATVQELGRTISDANYGIRGMANNLQQLSGLFVTLVSTSGGLVAGLNQMKKVLMGPLGIVILFQTFITLLEGGHLSVSRFSKEQRELNKAMAAGAKAAGAEVGELESLVGIAKDESLSRESRQDAVDKLNSSFPEYLGNLTLEKINTEETNSAIERQITLLQARAEVQALTNIITKESEKIFETLSKSGEENANVFDYLTSAFKSAGNAASFSSNLVVSGFARQDKKVQKSEEIIRLANEEIKKILSEVPNALSDANKKSETEVDKLADLLDKYKQKLREAEQESKAEVLREQRDAVLRTARALGASIAQLQPILDYFDVVIGKAQDTEITKQKADNLKVQLDRLKEIANKEKEIFTVGKQAVTELGQIRSQYFDSQIRRLDTERDTILNNENLTAEEKDRLLKKNDEESRKVQLKKIKFDRDIYMIEQGMELAKIALKAKNQMLELSMKGAESLADAKMSLGEFMRQLGPLGIAAYAVSIGGVVASIISARKKAKAQIASISGVSEAVSGSGGGTPSIQAPAFNVVGATQTSQLAQTIAQADGQPLRAYVVASDVTTAQELERSTIEGASIG
jgi:hypothetical protein|tara:strand:+ start:509 stop:2434 length:1926 start_codon:yes stop_codon:yes gene_type:complete